MLSRCMGWLACLCGQHNWKPHSSYHFILNDTGTRVYECSRCGKIRESG